MLAKFLDLNSKTLHQSSGKEQESRCLRSRPGQNVKLGTFTSCSRVATAKKCTKKRDAREKMLFFQSNHKPRVRTLLSSSNSMTSSMTFLNFSKTLGLAVTFKPF